MKPEIKIENYHCPIHGKVEVKSFLILDEWKGGTCSQCAEEKIRNREKEIAEIEEKKLLEQKKRGLENRLRFSAIPVRFQNKSFADFTAETEEKRSRKETCEKYAAEFPKNLAKGTSMIFCGSTGTGKTHLACSIANKIIHEHSATALFISVVDAVRTVKESYSKTSQTTEREAIASFTVPDLLILDEVGVQYGTDSERLILTEIINKRYEATKPSILISNLEIDALIHFLGDRIIDRLRENSGKYFSFQWESFRKSK